MTAVEAAQDSFYIAGRWSPATGTGTYDVVSPATGSVIATVAVPGIDEAEAAVAAAREERDYGTWGALSMDERADVLERFCQEFERRKDDFDAAWVAESGPTTAHAAGLDSVVPIMWRDSIAHARSLDVDEVRTVADGTVRVRREPAGVTVIVMTWNGPGLYLAMKMVPALLAGCPVILKTAVESQFTARLIGEMADAAGVPAGVLSVLAASTEVSEHLVGHPDVDKVSLTGSIVAGRSVMAACAQNITDVTLELGGKSPAIIVGDVPLDKVLPSLVPGFIAFQAQICAALTRVLVPRERQDEVADAISEQLSHLRVGTPDAADSDLGPLGSQRQLDRVMGYIDSAGREGARLVRGGGRPAGLDEGFYVEPTVFADVTPDMTIAKEEVFGPVLAIMPYDSVDEAVRIANGTEFGLAASVYAEDDAAAQDIAVRLDSGTVAINTAGVSLFAPFGGYKSSGLGRENGVEGIEEFLRFKSIKLT